MSFHFFPFALQKNTFVHNALKACDSVFQMQSIYNLIKINYKTVIEEKIACSATLKRKEKFAC